MESSLLPGPDHAVHLQVELLSAVAADFLATNLFSKAGWDANSQLAHDVPYWSGWKPLKVKKYISSQIDLPNGQVLNVLIDVDRPDKTIVYLK
ncbi:MAG: hypothetical protein U0795_26340 [Pirellulales bacterium]